jgi:hypothetical protein
VFHSNREGDASGDRLWTMTSDGDDVSQLTTQGEAEPDPAWGPR